MRRQLTSVFIILICFISCGQDMPDELYRPEKPQISKDTIMWAGFGNRTPSLYSDAMVIQDFGDIEWVSTMGRGSIITDSERGSVLRVAFPAKAIGPNQGGIQFIRTLPETNEYYLDYYLKFEHGFDFCLGGKLPGLTSGGSKFTGGVTPSAGEGWSARYMWTDKMPVVYLYYVDMPSKYGEPLALSDRFEAGKWYRLTQHIKLNDADKQNGSITVWIDGKQSLAKSGIRFRIGEKGYIDSFYFSTFHGGDTQQWAPKNDSYACFDDILITTTPIDFSK